MPLPEYLRWRRGALRAGRRDRLAGPGRAWLGGRCLTGLGHELAREVRLDEGPLEYVDGVRFPDQPLGLVGAVWRLDAPQVDPDAEGLGRLDRRDHVLVPGDQDGVGDGPVPGQRLHVGPDLGVYALLLATRVEVAEPQLDPRHLGDDALVDRGHPVPGCVVPVDPQQLAADVVLGVPGQSLDQLVGIDPVFLPGRSAEQQLTGRRIDVPDIDHDRVAGQQGQRRARFGHSTDDSNRCRGH